MARTVTEKMTCDKCGASDPANAYTIHSGGTAVVLDLCDKCAKPLESLMAKGTSGPRSKRNPPSRPQGHSVVPVD